MIALLHLPAWGQYLLEGILIFVLLAASSVTLTKAGKNPYFALLMIVPYAQVIAVWALAFMAWKRKA